MANRTLSRAGSRDCVILRTTSEESAGQLFCFEYVARDVGPMPREHVHADVDERVQVLAGRLHLTIEGSQRVLEEGEMIDIPRGVRHAVWNASPEGSRSLGEFRPAGDIEEAFRHAFPLGA